MTTLFTTERGTHFLACAALVMILGCGDDTSSPPPPPPADETPPVVTITFPVTLQDPFPQTEYDETGNGLLDLRVEWTDDDSGIDPSTARVQVLEGVNGSAGPDDDLLDVWDVESLDEVGLLAHELLEELLHPETSHIVASVADSAGNIGVDTLEVILPYGAYHTTTPLGLDNGIGRDISICEDDGLLYVPVDRTIAIMDPLTFQMVGTHATVSLPEEISSSLCIPGDPHLYITARVHRFHRTAHEFSYIEGTFCTDALTQSKVDPEILYVGNCGSGTIARVNRVTEEYLGHVGIPSSSFGDEFVAEVEVLPGDEKIYFTRFWEGGLVVGDPIAGELITRINLSVSDDTPGQSNYMAQSPDGQWLYVSVDAGNSTGLAEINTDTDAVTRFMELDTMRMRDVALNPAGTRVFMTTGDKYANINARSLLIDVVNWRVLEEYPRPVPPGETTFVTAAAFHPNGKLVYQTRDLHIDVFINRE